MATVLGLDLGTTTISAVAVDTASGAVLARAGRANASRRDDPAAHARGHAEQDLATMTALAGEALRDLAGQLGSRRDLAGLGLTGQQHGVALVDRHLRPETALISWQDRRGEAPMPGEPRTWVQEARRRVGEDAVRRTGCRLSAGYQAVTLFWLAGQRQLPEAATACFATDYLTAWLTGTRPATEPTNAASSGIFDVARGDWAFDLIDALELPRSLFPPVRPSGEPRGGLTPESAAATGLPAGLPVFLGIGDNQASFLGSVADPAASVLVNVGTGGQVAVWSPRFLQAPQLETRPFPTGGYLLVSAGLCGGAAYATLQRFFAAVGTELFATEGQAETIYAVMNRLAGDAPPGCDGLVCEPFFSGSRAEPERRGVWAGLTPVNFTPGHLCRSLLEGMARAFAASGDLLVSTTGRNPQTLVGAGNGIRENPLLAGLLADAFHLPLQVPAHREEAAHGAALLAALRAGLVPAVEVGRLIRHASSG